MTDIMPLLSHCEICPRRCGVDRLKNECGFCGTGRNPKISAYNVHRGEEPPISGSRGSGTVFFTGCNMRCVFCQNYPISQMRHGNEVTVDKLAGIMLGLQKEGVHNINFVTPTHVALQMMEAVSAARAKGLDIPVVYNSSGYESVDTLRMLEGTVDVYLPDIKYSDDRRAEKYSSTPGYWATVCAAVKEMHRQKGVLKMKGGIAVSGLLVRHLVLPRGIAGSKRVLEFIAREISKDTYVSIMAQYHPANKTGGYPELDRKITASEYSAVLGFANELGLANGWRQEM